MARPTDHVDGEDNPTGSLGEVKPALRKVPIIDPGFREEMESSVLRPRILGMKQPADPRDRRNLKFLGVAFLVSVVIFAVLEIKQFREAAREAKHSAMEFMGGK